MYGRISRISRGVTYTGSALLAGVPTRFTMAFLGCSSDAPDHSAHAGIPAVSRRKEVKGHERKRKVKEEE